MSQITQRTVKLGTRPGNTSDVAPTETVVFAGGTDTDGVDTLHDVYPETGRIEASAPGARLHFLGFADTVEGNPAIPEIPAVNSATGILPPIGDLLGAATSTFADNATFAVTAQTDPTTPQFFAFYLAIGAGPSGLIWETGDSDGAYVGFVNGKLVVRNGTGADLRVDASQLEGRTGTLCVHFDPTNGQVQAWFGEEDTPQFEYLGTSSGTAGNWHGAAGSGTYHAAQNGTANIEGGTGNTPATADARHTNTSSSSFSANMPSHSVGDMLVASISMHPYGGNNLVDASVAGWTRILDHDGASGSYAPTMQIFTKLATKTSEKCQVSCSGATKNWEKTAIVMTIEDCKQVTATLGDVQNGGNSTIDFPAAVGSPGLVLHGYAASVKADLSVPSGESLVEESGSYPRTQLWSDAGATTTAVTGHGIDTYPGHTSVTLNVFGDTSGEGVAAPSNVTVSAVTGPANGPDADTWTNEPVPSNIMDLGTVVDEGTPLVPAVDATPFTAGSSDAAYSEITAGAYLESVHIRLKQTRTAAGLWTARLAAIDSDGFYQYGAPLRPPFDVTTTGDPEDRLLTKQSSFGNGKSVHAAISEGWLFGVLLETITEDNESEFGFAELDVAELVFNFIQPPVATILFPVAGGTSPTVTPQIGWQVNAVDEVQNQVSYRVRVWETATFDAADPPTGRIAFDSGLIFSRSERAHQVSRPLRPDIGYTVGVQLEGEALSGRRVLANWVTADFTTPSPVIDVETQGQDTVTVTATVDGQVEITAATFTDDAGDWGMIERARVADLDAAAAADLFEETYVALESQWLHSRGWEAPITAGSIAATGGNGVLEVEVRGTWSDPDTFENGYIVAYSYSDSLQGGVALYFDSTDGKLTLGLQDETTFRTTAIPLTEWDATFTPGLELWIRVQWNIDTAATGNNVVWETTLDGVTWTEVYTTATALGLVTGPDTTGSTDAIALGSLDTASNEFNLYAAAGFLRSVKIVNTNDVLVRRVLLDVDLDRDTGGDDSVASFTDTAGYLFAPFNEGDSRLVTRGPNPAAYPKRIAATGGTYNSGLDVGLSSTGLPARITGSTWELMNLEWFGVINDDGQSNEKSLAELAVAAGDRKFDLVVESDRLEVYIYDSLGSMSWKATSGTFSPYYGRHIGIRVSWDNNNGACFFYITVDDGKTWLLHYRDGSSTLTGTTTNPVAMTAPVVTDTFFLMGSHSATRHHPGQCESFRLWSLTDQDMLIDVDLARDVTDLTSSSITDALGMGWTLGNDSTLTTRSASRTIPAEQADDLWLPLVGLRELVVGNTTTPASPRMTFTDPAPPQHEPVAYRVRIIDEPAPTFESTSTEWVESAPVFVETDSWWLSTLSGSSRFALEPSTAGWSEDRPGIIASGVGRSLHITVKDVLKSRTITVEALTRTQANLDDLRHCLDSGDTLMLSDVHGRSSLVEPFGPINTVQVRSAAWGGETAPVGRTYATSFSLVEVEDPRDFGFGSNLRNV